MNKDDSTLLQISYVVFALLLAFVFWSALQTLGIQTGWADRYDEWYPMFATAISLVGAVASVWGLNRNSDRRDYFLASIAELRKVTWPSYLDTRRMTIVVCIVVGVFSVILALFDFLWSKILGVLLA